jgi:hypothetical protein
MRIRLVSLSVLMMLWGSALAHATVRPTYSLALGDSLAQGVLADWPHNYLDSLADEPSAKTISVVRA